MTLSEFFSSMCLGMGVSLLVAHNGEDVILGTELGSVACKTSS